MDSFTLRKVEFHRVRRILGRFCATSLGKALASRINPSRNPGTIRRWLRQVSQMVDAVRDVALPPFAGVTDITDPLARAHPSGGATGEDFAAIASALEGAANVKGYLNGLDEGLDELHRFASEIATFESEVRAIREVIEPDGSIRDDASQRLGRIRGEIAATAKKIHDVIYGYLQNAEVAKLLQASNVTLHGDRYVLPVKAENRGRLPGVVHRASNTGATVFVEPNASVELNNHLADLYNDERREIERLLNMLSIHVQARTREITTTMRVIGQVDLVSAKAQYAYQFELTCPEVVERGELEYRQARHPLLLDQYHRRSQKEDGPKAEPVVPIDVRLGQDFDLLVITGSNTGGKTVALKTVALLALMAQSGMHIPAGRGSRMPVFRDVYIDIGDEQSLQQSLSTFGAHVKRLRHILHKADAGCLVLLDELGAGTDPDEGGAIGQAVLDELLTAGCVGMVTTHLSVLKAYAFNHDRVDNASVEFDTKTMSPTYHLRIGKPGESHAIAVAKRLGLTKRVIAASRRHLSDQGKQFRRAIRATGQARQVAEEAREQAIQAELAAKSQQESYESQLADLHRLKGEFETWLATLPELQPGDVVHVPSLHKEGRLVRLELHRQIAVVDADNVQVEVPLHELMPDFGQNAVRQELAGLRKQVLEQAKETERIRAEAEHARHEYHRSLQQQRDRARAFDEWLAAIGRVKVGDEVPIAMRPGKGTVKELDFRGLRAVVETHEGEKTVSIQELFPESGPYSRRGRGEKGRRDRKGRGGRESGKGGERRGGKGGGRRDDRGPREETPPEKNRPMDRGRKAGKAAQTKRDRLLALAPGDKVYVVPFHKRATLIRFQPEKDIAVVQSGIFEVEIPLTDLEPIRVEPKPQPKKKPAPESKGKSEGEDKDKGKGAEAPEAGGQAPGEDQPGQGGGAGGNQSDGAAGPEQRKA